VLHLPPRARLGFWRLVIGLCVALPLVPVVESLPRIFPDAVLTTVVATMADSSHNAEFLSTSSVVFALLAVGGAVRLLWLGFGLFGLRRLRRGAVAVAIDAYADLRDAIAPRAACCWHDAIAQPMTFGAFRPIVLLPRRLVELSPAAQRAVVCHELLHVARGDWAWLLIEEVFRTAFWFHPAVWWALGQLHLSREEVVDDLVVRTTAARREYMSALVALAQGDAAPALPFMRARQLRARIAHLAGGIMTAPRLLIVRFALSAAVALLAGMISVSALSVQRGGAEAGPKVYEAGNGVLLPSVVKQVRPQYSESAKQRKIQGTVLLTCVVATSGVPGDITLVRALDDDLDRNAIDALKEWRFKPGTKDGKPVPVKVTVELTFTLK
jgi:TonB family protein